MHTVLWLIGLWVATVVVIWRVMFVLDQPARSKTRRVDNVLPFPSRRAPAEVAEFPLKRHNRSQPSRRS